MRGGEKSTAVETGLVVFEADKADSYDKDMWDDAALIKAYNAAVASFKPCGAGGNSGSSLVDAMDADCGGNDSDDAMTHLQRIAGSKRTMGVSSWKEGDVCRAVYEEDGLRYDAVIKEMHEDDDELTCTVLFLDYGNVATVRARTLRAITNAADIEAAKEKAVAMLESDDDDVDDDVDDNQDASDDADGGDDALEDEDDGSNGADGTAIKSLGKHVIRLRHADDVDAPVGHPGDRGRLGDSSRWNEGDHVLAVFSGDGLVYPGTVEKVLKDGCVVVFEGYGNTDFVSSDSIWTHNSAQHEQQHQQQSNNTPHAHPRSIHSHAAHRHTHESHAHGHAESHLRSHTHRRTHWHGCNHLRDRREGLPHRSHTGGHYTVHAQGHKHSHTHVQSEFKRGAAHSHAHNAHSHAHSTPTQSHGTQDVALPPFPPGVDAHTRDLLSSWFYTGFYAGQYAAAQQQQQHRGSAAKRRRMMDSDDD